MRILLCKEVKKSFELFFRDLFILLVPVFIIEVLVIEVFIIEVFVFVRVFILFGVGFGIFFFFFFFFPFPFRRFFFGVRFFRLVFGRDHGLYRVLVQAYLARRDAGGTAREETEP